MKIRIFCFDDYDSKEEMEVEINTFLKEMNIRVINITQSESKSEYRNDGFTLTILYENREDLE